MKKNHQITEIVLSNKKFIEEYLALTSNQEYYEDYTIEYDPEEEDYVDSGKDNIKEQTLEDLYIRMKKDSEFEGYEYLKPLVFIYENFGKVVEISKLRQRSHLTKKLLFYIGTLRRLTLFTSSEWKGIESLLFPGYGSEKLFVSFEELLASGLIYSEIEIDEVGAPKEDDLGEHYHRSYWRCPNKSAISYAKLFAEFDKYSAGVKKSASKANFKRPPNDIIQKTDIRIIAVLNEEFINQLIDQIQKEKLSIGSESYKNILYSKSNFQEIHQPKLPVYLDEENIDSINKEVIFSGTPGRKKYSKLVQVFLSIDQYNRLSDLGGTRAMHIRNALDDYFALRYSQKERLEKKLGETEEKREKIVRELERIEKNKEEEEESNRKKQEDFESKWKEMKNAISTKVRLVGLRETINDKNYLASRAEYLGITQTELINLIKKEFREL